MKTYKEFLDNQGEKKWQDFWEEHKLFEVPENFIPEDKFYILDMFPYPSGSGLHVGHVEGYTATDILARWQRMNNKQVLRAIGWDAFGLPAENYAIKTGIHPRINTEKSIETFRQQMKAIGLSYDWKREINTSDPGYYKWTQWFFLLLYKRGLVYRKKQAVNWCDSCKTVLANDQVKEGHCERCDTVVVQKDMEQWYIKITDYAERLLNDIDKLDWPEETKKRQKDWIGRSEGAEVYFSIKDNDMKLRVFTTRPDTLFGATYMVLAPEGQYVQDLKDQILNWDEVQAYIDETAKKTDLDRQVNQEKTGVKLEGVMAINPVNNEEIPVFVADYVLASYGTGAIMAVPAHDERDYEFAKKYKIQKKYVIVPHEFYYLDENGENIILVHSRETQGIILEKMKGVNDGDGMCYSDIGVSVNSDFLNGLSVEEAKPKMIEYLEENGIGAGKVQYKLRDWSVSRQRFWGAPIPMLYDDKGELHPVPEKDLPVILPDDVDFKPTGESPLNYSKSFNEGVEEKYGAGWKREPDTLDTFMCSSWYYFRYLDPKNDGAFASPEALKQWMPVDFYQGGPEHVTGHLIYSRFFTKVLFDAGYIDFEEPFTKLRHQGLILGPDNRKMSKRWGNVVNPTDVVNTYGADTMRMYEMFMGPLEDDKPWDENGVKGVRRFLEKVWKYYSLRDHEKDLEIEKELENTSKDSAFFEAHKKQIKELDYRFNYLIKKIGADLGSLKFNTAIAEMMKFVNEFLIIDLTENEEWKDSKYTNKLALIRRKDKLDFIKLLSPLAPHIADELWEMLGNKGSVSTQDWPEPNKEKLVEDKITLAVQVNGKLRATITVPADVSEDDAKAQALAEENVIKWLEGKEPKKVIYVKGKLVSIVV